MPQLLTATATAGDLPNCAVGAELEEPDVEGPDRDEFSLRMQSVSKEVAIAHALNEAGMCVRNHAFCGGLAMLRRAVDLWTKMQHERYHFTFDRSKREHNSLYWRLVRIAEQNPIYSERVHNIIDGLRLRANAAVHDPVICDVEGSTFTYASNFADRDRAYRRLERVVRSLVQPTG